MLHGDLQLYTAYVDSAVADASVAPTKRQWLEILVAMERTLQGIVSATHPLLSGLSDRRGGLDDLAGESLLLLRTDPAFLFAMSRAAERAGLMDKSWRYLSRGNALELLRYSHPASINADLPPSLQLLARTSATNSSARDQLLSYADPTPVLPLGDDRDLYTSSVKLLRGKHASPRAVIAPLFVLGLPYMGADELATVLDSFPSIVGVSADPEYFRALSRVTDSSYRYSAFQGSTAASRLRQGMKVLRTWQEQLSSLGDRVSAQELQMVEDARGKVIGQMQSALVDMIESHWVLNDHVNNVRSSSTRGSSVRASPRYVMDYDPASFTMLDDLLEAFPGQVFIALTRHPLDTLLLNYRHPLVPEMGQPRAASMWAYNLTSAARRIAAYEVATARARRHCAQDGPAGCTVLDVAFVDLKNDPEAVAQRLVQALLPDAPPSSRLLLSSEALRRLQSMDPYSGTFVTAAPSEPPIADEIPDTGEFWRRAAAPLFAPAPSVAASSAPLLKGWLPSEDAREAVALLRRCLGEAESLGELRNYLAWKADDI
jgi:hypothetical protein